MADLSDQINSTAAGPAHAAGDAGEMTAQPLQALIQADRYLSAKAGLTTKRRGVRYSKIIPAGPMADQQASGIGGVNFASPGGLI
jgi:hypothetical protein